MILNIDTFLNSKQLHSASSYNVVGHLTSIFCNNDDYYYDYYYYYYYDYYLDIIIIGNYWCIVDYHVTTGAVITCKTSLF